MIERVIENWLTSVNERQYQLQFCQMLASEGEIVIYVSKHGPAELGKDVITIAPSGTPRCYQLKRGDIDLKAWRGFEGEINQLVEIDPHHPSLPADPPKHESYFVTSGTVSDPVLNAISHKNATWAKRGYGPLRCLQKHELVTRFRDAQGIFPIDPLDLKSFLELYTSRGQAPLEKEKFAEFIEGLLSTAGGSPSNLEVRRAAASSVLIATYALQNQTRENNHWAVFEGWIVTGAAILWLATKSKAPKPYWSYSFELCHEQAQNALNAMSDECQERGGQFFQGSPFSDGYVYRVRMTLLCGLLAALRLSLGPDEQGDNWEKTVAFIDEFLLANHAKMQLWGEAAVPYFIMTALGLERRGRHALSERIIVQIVRTICTVSGKGAPAPGLTNPYWSIEQSLRLYLGLDPQNREEFLGTSYTLLSLVHMLARRELKQTLKLLWADLTGVDYATLIFKDSFEWLTWKSTSALLDTRAPNQPEHWNALVEAATGQPSANLPENLIACGSFAACFLLVYPQRCHPALVKTIDDWSRSAD